MVIVIVWIYKGIGFVCGGYAGPCWSRSPFVRYNLQGIKTPKIVIRRTLYLFRRSIHWPLLFWYTFAQLLTYTPGPMWCNRFFIRGDDKRGPGLASLVMFKRATPRAPEFVAAVASNNISVAPPVRILNFHTQNFYRIFCAISPPL